MFERVRSWLGGVFWGRKFVAGGQTTWMAEPAARRYINESVTASRDIWPIDWLEAHLETQPLQRCVSLGCGAGGLERDLRSKQICGFVLGLDISSSAIEIARSTAEKQGIDGVEYRRADLNRLELKPGSFDGAFFHQSLHHVEALGRCLDVVAQAVRPGGLVYLDEYVGPSRGEWERPLIAAADEIYQRLPESVRRRRRLALPVDWRDPTEAIRSSEIMRNVRSRFEVVQERGYGGNFLSVIYPHLSLAHLEDERRAEILNEIIAAEQAQLAGGVGSYYRVVVCRAKGSEGRPIPTR